ncbi:methyltransferase [Pokkaliibacter plantistimulans]|uniref:Methyltransferase n=1 Tax=Proteobacteria bacterium 228 TaxID=2083153 RepID=A0A2S5KNH5_9PROT|nr:methyltransferase [Pokkaliibacter plantistimulans]PPC76079.1 methyltransferase [Pokkaliibacter plantistimulans]
MSENLADRFEQLSQLLVDGVEFWQQVPFKTEQLDWQKNYRPLWQALQRVDDEQLQRFEDDPEQAESWLTAWLPVTALQQLSGIPATGQTALSLPSTWGDHMPGRKWQQVCAFVSGVTIASPAHLLEWCAGKGHLARTISRLHQVPVTALEWQASLCEEGERLSRSQNTSVTAVAQDVLADSVCQHLQADSHVLALHACGDLHRRLIALATPEKMQRITLAPCCYHLTEQPVYQPLSRRGQQICADLQLSISREQLRLAVQETVTAPAYVRRQRRQASIWRLAFDLLRQTLQQDSQYLSMPSIPYGQLPAAFADFCLQQAEQLGCSIPDQTDFAHWLQQGEVRYRQVRLAEVVRHLYRRPLEVWLVLDRALALEEQGFSVALSTFCARELTPRNILLSAHRP